jgi:general stress protein 26
MHALQKRIFELARSPQLMNLATLSETGEPRVRYVVGSADEQLTLRFSTHLDSVKVQELRANAHVAVTMGATSTRSSVWLQIEGVAEVRTDEAERRGFWFDELKGHFTGLDDPRYCVVRITPRSIGLGSEVWRPAA